MKRLILEQSSDEFYTSHSGLARVGACINRHSDLSRRAGRQSRGTERISDIDILRGSLGLLSLGKSDVQASTAMQGDDCFRQAQAIERLPSAESLRQRLDAAGASGLTPQVFRAAHTMLKQLGVRISAGAQGLVPLDVDVFLQENSNTSKQGVSRTYKNFDGYAPIAAYLGLEGWWTNLEMAPEEVIGLYRDHATSERCHSEFKTDPDLERLPSGKFATNALVMALGCLTSNSLRAIGQLGLPGEFSPIRHPAKGRRIRTVMQESISLAGRLPSRGRRLIVRFGRHCPGFAAFKEVYGQLAPAR